MHHFPVAAVIELILQLCLEFQNEIRIDNKGLMDHRKHNRITPNNQIPVQTSTKLCTTGPLRITEGVLTLK